MIKWNIRVKSFRLKGEHLDIFMDGVRALALAPAPKITDASGYPHVIKHAIGEQFYSHVLSEVRRLKNLEATGLSRDELRRINQSFKLNNDYVDEEIPSEGGGIDIQKL